MVSLETRKKMSDSHKGNKYALGFKHSAETRLKVSLAGKGKKRSLETRRKMSLAQMGNKKNLGKKMSLETRKKIGVAQLGEKNHAWRGGITSLKEIIRGSFEYKLWRKAVFERDNYTCIWCGFKGYVEADHIKPFALFPELRFAIDNGRTLCKKCHKNTETYGRWK